VFHANYDVSIVASDLENITFANHDLMTDSVFGEMQLILCRNVLIYFDYTLQGRVYKIFTDSVFYKGFLCLGCNECMGFSEVCDYFKVVDGTQKNLSKDSTPTAWNWRQKGGRKACRKYMYGDL